MVAIFEGGARFGTASICQRRSITVLFMFCRLDKVIERLFGCFFINLSLTERLRFFLIRLRYSNHVSFWSFTNFYWIRFPPIVKVIKTDPFLLRNFTSKIMICTCCSIKWFKNYSMCFTEYFLDTAVLIFRAFDTH